MPEIEEIFLSSVTVGSVLPLSQFDTVAAETPSFSANSFCDICAFTLHAAIEILIFCKNITSLAVFNPVCHALVHGKYNPIFSDCQGEIKIFLDLS